MTIRSYLQSFSFRAGITIFAAFCIVLVALRILFYFQVVELVRGDIQAIIRAYESEIKVTLEQSSETIAEEYIKSLLEETRDRHFIIAMRKADTSKAKEDNNSAATKTGNIVIGNIENWPQEAEGGKEWAEFYASYDGNQSQAHILSSITHYPQGFSLLIGYDTAKLEALEGSLVATLLQNVFYALVASFLLSTALIFLLNRHMRRLNQAFAKIQKGKLDYRIPVGVRRDEFDRLSENFNHTMDWIKTLLHAVKESGNALAHDMRTPLSHLRLEMQQLLDHASLDEKAKHLAEAQIQRVDSLIEMFENVLLIAKAESRSRIELFEDVDFQKLVQDVVDFYAPIIEEKKINLFTDLEFDIKIQGDKQLLGQAIMNLIDNACKYTAEGGKISVHLTKNDQIAELIIDDNGPGIAPELIEKVKERFFRADESRHTDGHGLGLSLVNAVAELHQGQLHLENNTPGLKARMTLKF